MASAAQIIANHSNSLLSTGPRTENGRAASKMNAYRHGLTSKTLVMSSEDRAAFEEMEAGLLACFSPVGDIEEGLVKAVAAAHWRSLRAERAETAFFGECINDLCEKDPELDPETAFGRLFFEPDYARRLSLFLRYRSAATREYWRVRQQLLDMQKERKDREALAAVFPVRSAALSAPATVPAGQNGFVSQSAPKPVKSVPTLPTSTRKNRSGFTLRAPDPAK